MSTLGAEAAMTDSAWLDEGLQHIWLPYAQMKTAPRPVSVKATRDTFSPNR